MKKYDNESSILVYQLHVCTTINTAFSKFIVYLLHDFQVKSWSWYGKRILVSYQELPDNEIIIISVLCKNDIYKNYCTYVSAL